MDNQDEIFKTAVIHAISNSIFKFTLVLMWSIIFMPVILIGWPFAIVYLISKPVTGYYKIKVAVKTLEQIWKTLTRSLFVSSSLWLYRSVFYAIFSCASILIVYIFVFIGVEGFASSEISEWGAVGDFVGGALNPLLSFCAFITLLWTIKLQTKELRKTNKALKNTAKSQRQQEVLMMEQKFDTSFFELLNKFQIEQNIDIKPVSEMPTIGLIMSNEGLFDEYILTNNTKLNTYVFKAEKLVSGFLIFLKYIESKNPYYVKGSVSSESSEFEVLYIEIIKSILTKESRSIFTYYSTCYRNSKFKDQKRVEINELDRLLIKYKLFRIFKNEEYGRGEIIKIKTKYKLLNIEK
ncbi:MAG: hypothetical protein HRU38_12770 [Saccharospirillaceae bacterium]|nr:hypothetical protein [Pseudomonadales bacterium]NRB79517.1 hypothetical protein [Saccharospirillaceae bacterium]